MAIRQYVGARYVPRFLGTYDVTQQYEALDVVDNGSGTSYIARKIVPPGTPLTDNEYWFLYGASSGAIIQLQNDMLQAQGDIGDLQNDVTNISNVILPAKADDIRHGKWLFVGDSFDSITSGWIDSTAAHIGVESYYKVSDGGVGFTRQGSEGRTWKEMIEYRVNQSSIDPDLVEWVCVVGGGNDNNADGAVLNTAMGDFVAYCIATFPKLNKIFIGYCGYTNTIHIANSRSTYLRYKQFTLNTAGCAFLDGMFAIPYTPGNMQDNDISHPNSTGCNYIIQGVCAGIISGIYKYNVTSSNPMTINSTAFTGNANTMTGPTITDGNIVFMNMSGGIKGTFNSGYRTGTVAEFLAFAHNSPYRSNQFIAFDLYNETTRASVPCTLRPSLTNSAALDLYFPAGYDAGTDYHRINPTTLFGFV